jgi:V/A-type H+-transporting ATPase subunit I
MFYPAEMRWVGIVFHDAYTGDVIRDLQNAGVMEVLPLHDVQSPLPPGITPKERSSSPDRITEAMMRIDRIFDTFAEIPSPKENPLLTFLSPSSIIPLTRPERSEEELLHETASVLQDLQQVSGIRAALRQASGEYTAAVKNREAIRILAPFGFDLGILGDGVYLSVTAGLVEKEKYEAFHQDLLSAGTDELLIGAREQDTTVVVVVAIPLCHKHLLERILRPPRFHPLVPGCSGMPAEALAAEQERIGTLQARESALIEELRGIRQEWEGRLHALYENLEHRKEQRQVLSGSGKSTATTIMSGWVPEKEVQEMERVLEQASENHALVRWRHPSPEDPGLPSCYENPGWLKPFEVLTTTFARPLYREVDPTPFVAPFFVFFFGLMLGDAGYGIIMTLIAAFLYIRLKDAERSLHDMVYILLILGVASTLLGIIQGGWFGDIPERFFAITPPFILIEPLKDPITFFQIALILGIIHINLGLAIAAYQHLRSGEYRMLFFEEGVWFILQPSAAVLLAGFFGWFAVSPPLLYAAAAGALLGVGMLFSYQGAMGFFGLTGFLGDWLSYVRILALALATGGIAMTINILSTLIAGIHPLMVVPAAIIFIGGHAFNLVIQSLGGVIHAIRLQYIEFFGKFYTGGGRAFSPFRSHRRYSQITERDIR